MAEAKKGGSVGEEEARSVAGVPAEEEGVEITAEIEELREGIEELRQTPEFGEEVQFLEGEVRELEAFRRFVLRPGLALDEELEAMESSISEIRGALGEIAKRNEAGQHIPIPLKYFLIRVGRLLIRIQRWLLWLCRFIPFPPWRRRCRRIAKLITRIGLLLIWIARRFCAEAESEA